MHLSNGPGSKYSFWGTAFYCFYLELSFIRKTHTQKVHCISLPIIRLDWFIFHLADNSKSNFVLPFWCNSKLLSIITIDPVQNISLLPSLSPPLQQYQVTVYQFIHFTYLSCCLPGEIHRLNVDRDSWHSLLSFSEIMSKWGHLFFWNNQNILFKACKIKPINLKQVTNQILTWDEKQAFSLKGFYRKMCRLC